MGDSHANESLRSEPNTRRLQADKEFEFVNKEIDRYLDLWKHTDEHLLGMAPPFLALTLAVVPGAVLLADVVEDSRTFYIACIPIALVLAVIAALTAVRVQQGELLKAWYWLVAGALRRYLIERADETLRDYSPAYVQPDRIPFELTALRRAAPLRLAVYSALVASAGLCGTATMLAAWWLWLSVAPGSLTLIGAFASAVALIGLRLLLKSRRERFIDRLQNQFDSNHVPAADS